MVPFDWQAHDTYFIVAHLHYVLIGGMVFPLFAAIYYWTPMSSARPLSERLGKWVFWLMFVGMHLAFLPMHLTGLMGMPRRVYTYLPGRSWEIPNLVSTVGAFLFAAAVLLWVVDMIRNFRPFGGRDAGNVYEGPGLEWLPTGLYSVRSIPVVQSLYPLWEQKNLARDVAAGRYFLPGSATGERETIVTSTINAEPQYLQRMPKPSPWHVWAAVFTAGFFLLLTVQAYAVAAVNGVLAVWCLFHWAWLLDKPMPQAQADIGAGIVVPTYANGPSSHGWWAMVITLIVAGMVAALAGFSYVFLWSRQPDLWAAPPPLRSTVAVAIGYGLAALLAWPALAKRAPRPGLTAAALAAASLVGTGAWVLDLTGWWDAGLRPDRDAQGATVFALLSWQGMFAACGLLMGLFALLRRAFGYLAPDRNTSLQLIGLFLVYTALQGGAAALLTRLFPGA
jgi:cytochrome c oxidase subunit I+III